MKKYIILLNAENCTMCGTDNTGITEYKMFSYILKQAQRMVNASMFGVSAYLINNYTQKMCEMSPKEMGLHVIKNGTKLI